MSFAGNLTISALYRNTTVDQFDHKVSLRRVEHIGMGARPVFPPSTVRMFPNQLSWSKSTKLAHTLWASFALALLSVTHVRACKVGWKGEIHQFNHENVDNMHEVQSVGEHIIPETRISVIWKELDITTDTNEAWPDAPLDKDGNKAHEYFHARFHGFIHIPKYGDYEFHLTSDDGAKLFIDGLQVIDNDGIQAANRKSKVEKLHKGFHIVEVCRLSSGIR